MSSLFFNSKTNYLGAASHHPLWLPLDNVTTTNNCSDGVQWILQVFQQCVIDPQHYAAVICGMLSILAWTINAIPQIVENCRQGIADEAMSPFLLLFWTLGDILNLLGCIFTHQLILQYYTAGYSIICDMVLISQYILAKVRHRIARYQVVVTTTGEGCHSINNADNVVIHASNERLLQTTTTGSLLSGLFLGWALCGLGWQLARQASPDEKPLVGRRLLFHVPVFVDSRDILGYVLGCASSAAYLFARLPQLYRNYSRRSTVGLSMGLFVLALLANLMYGLQIFLTSLNGVFLLRHFPWLLGSLGVLFLDLIMLFQFHYYRRRGRIIVERMEESLHTDVLIYT